MSVVAYIIIKTSTDLNKWTYKHLDLLLQAGDQFFVDSFNAYHPPSSKITLETLLRRVIIKDREVKIEIKTPKERGHFDQEHLLADVINVFNLTTSCILNFQDYFITLYFKSGYYYVFDPYGLDLSGSRNNDDGVAALMRYSNLDTMVQDIINNLVKSYDHENNYVLIFLGIQNVQSLSKK